MPIPIACPNCKNPINAPEAAAGKTITCWKCSTVMSVLIPDADIVSPRRGTVAAKKSKLRIEVDDDDDDREDDRPVRRPKAAKKSKSPVLLIAGIGGGILLLGILAVGGYLLFGGKAGVAGGIIPGKAPPGYSNVGEVGVRCRAFIPGNAKGNFARTTQDPKSPINPNLYVAMAHDESSFVAHRTPGFTPGTSEDQLMKRYEEQKFFVMLGEWKHKWEIRNKKMITVAGQPALQFTMVERPDIRDNPAGKADFFQDKNDKEKERVAREGKQMVVIVATNGEWTYLIGIIRTLKEPDPETVRTVIESVTFL
jgi:hypothetical protein